MTQQTPDEIIADLMAAAARLRTKLRASQARERALEETLRPFAEAWARTAPQPRPGDNPKAYPRRLERALEGFHSTPGRGSESRLILTGQHLKDAHDLLVVRNDTSHTNEKDYQQ